MMRLYLSTLILIFCMSCSDTERNFEYPFIENVQKVETHFDISYVNDYVNLEKFKDSAILGWFHKQDTIAKGYFESNSAFETYLNHINKYATAGSSGVSNIKYDERVSTYYLQDTLSSSILFRRNTQTGTNELLFDPVAYFDKDLVIEYYRPSYDGKHVAIAVGKDSDFFQSIIILNTESKEVIAEIDTQSKPNMVGGIVWTPDNASILLIAYPNTSDEERINDSYMGRYEIGQEKNRITPIFKNGDFGITVHPEFYILPKIRSENDTYVFVYIANANEYWDCYYTTYEAFKNGNYNWQKLFAPEDQTLNDYGTERNHQYYYKRVKDGNIQLCQLDLRSPDIPSKVLYQGSGEEQLSNFKVIDNAIYYSVSSNGVEESLFKIDEVGEVIQIELPKSPGEISFKYRSPYLNDLWLELTGWTINYEDYKVLPNNSLVRESFPKANNYPEINEIMSQVIEVPSHDGTLVPVSIVHRRDFNKEGTNKAIVSVYGAYGISETPWFHEPILDFVNQGNIYVTAHVRGGGEKGPKWHEDGMMLNKSNSWKDLNHVAKFLIAEGWVHPKKIGLNANSAGAISAGMAVSTAPELYGALTIFNGAVNGIRTESIAGYDATDNAYEFGSTSDSLSYKSFVQLDTVVNFNAEVDYPSTLLFMGYQDYLIPPSANGKYIALMQSANSRNNRPYLLDVGFDSEHEIDWYSDYAKVIFFINAELDR